MVRGEWARLHAFASVAIDVGSLRQLDQSINWVIEIRALAQPAELEIC
jgi:hypothetical protein